MSNTVKTGGTDPNNATNPNTFGRSLESQAQIHDAALKSSPSVAKGEVLNIYRLVPIAAPNDPGWDNAPSSREVVVAARTAGDARIVAAGRELDFMEVDAAPAEHVTTSNARAFRNEKLYTVIEVAHGRSDLQRGILEGTVSVSNLRPVED
jgi:hypothetical protein